MNPASPDWRPATARRAAAVALAAACATSTAVWAGRAQAPARPPGEAATAQVAADPASYGVIDWLRRMHLAARRTSYVGTFVVTGATGNLSSARIWHACDADLQIERVETLSGPPRSTFRRNDLVMTFLPEAKLIKSERRENFDVFPNLLGASESSIAELYGARLLGKGRVAGIDADVLQLAPRDALRFGYRVWSERRSGLVLKLQTLDAEGRVVEQSAFSELQLDAPVKTHALAQMMNNTAGYRVERSELERTTPAAEGWSMRSPVAGFKPVSCYRRALTARGAEPGERTMQWTFSDGLATVSLFVEPDDARRPQQEGTMALGATNTLTRRIPDAQGDWWLTAVGEVPAQTLDAFARNLVRNR